MKPLAAAALLATLAAVAACSKPQQPKVEFKQLDTAKALQNDVNTKAQDRGAAADQLSK